jgi:hypothetical protein
MSRWAEPFAAGGSDTADAIRQNGEPTPAVSHFVNSVRPAGRERESPNLKQEVSRWLRRRALSSRAGVQSVIPDSIWQRRKPSCPQIPHNDDLAARVVTELDDQFAEIAALQ